MNCSSNSNCEVHNRYSLLELWKQKEESNLQLKKEPRDQNQMHASNTLFLLYAPERIKIQPGETKKVLINFNVYVPEDILGIIVSFITFIKLKFNFNYKYTQPKQTLEKSNLNFSIKLSTLILIFKSDIRFMTINEGNKKFNVKCETFQRKIH